VKLLGGQMPHVLAHGNYGTQGQNNSRENKTRAETVGMLH
jgi:hypothetical protein